MKFVLATVVLYIANTYPQKPEDKIMPPKIPGNPDFLNESKKFFLYVNIKNIVTTKIKNRDLQNNICHKFAPSKDFTISPPNLRLKAPRKNNNGPGKLKIYFIFDLEYFWFP